MRQLIAGNWKMNGLHEEAAAIAGPLPGRRRSRLRPVGLPAVHPDRLGRASWPGRLSRSAGQDCHPNEKGAHTGDISAAMLRDAGASWVILGHSERRQDHHESDALVLAKTNAAIPAGLTPIVCVGETEAQRAAGDQNNVVGGPVGGQPAGGFRGVVAYEPVWAIGTGKTATEADVAAMHLFIRETLVSQLGDGRQRDPHPLRRLGPAIERGELAGGSACWRGAGRGRQSEGGGVSGDRQGREGVMACG
jgi:triosephosphate isomerase